MLSNPLGNNGGRTYSTLVKPVLVDVSFAVNQDAETGLGVEALRGAGIDAVYMHSTATFLADTHTTATLDGIVAGTENLRVGMHVSGAGIPVGAKILTIASPTSITLTAAATATAAGITVTFVAADSPNPAPGYALIHLANNYNRLVGMFGNAAGGHSGVDLAINASALTIGAPYIIVDVGVGQAGTVTIAPVADVAGSLSSRWFRLYDGYGNTFVIWFYVAGIGGSAPVGVSGTLVQQSIAQNATPAAIGTALASTIALLPSGIAGVFSFVTSGTTTVSVQNTKLEPLPGKPQDGLIPTLFTFAETIFNTNLDVWQAVGVPPGVVPAVGVSFIAKATGFSAGGGSTGLVNAPIPSGITAIEVVGLPSLSLHPIPMGGSPNVGGWVLLQFLAPTSATNTALIATEPEDGDIISLVFYVEQSSVAVRGEI